MRATLIVLCVTAALSGCGGGGGSSQSATNELRETTQRLGAIRSGDLALKLVVLPSSGTRGRIGFEITGPFALRAGALPVLDVRYTQFAGARQATARLVADGRNAVAFAGGRRIALSRSSVAELTSAGTGTSTVTTSLRIDSWLKNPRLSDGGVVAGAATDHISADLDVVNAANGLLGLLRKLGRNAPTITGSSADQLRKAVKSSSIDVWTGKQDKLLRRLDLKAKLAFDVPDELKRAFGSIVGANVEFELQIANPNKPVHVTVPNR
jgi:hypothetical protein